MPLSFATRLARIERYERPLHAEQFVFPESKPFSPKSVLDSAPRTGIEEVPAQDAVSPYPKVRRSTKILVPLFGVELQEPWCTVRLLIGEL